MLIECLILFSKIQEESNNIEQLLGDVDEDTKQALIFGQLIR